MSLWQSFDLVLAQTCGLPYATSLRSRVRLVGTPSYDIGCAPGFYYSVLITPAGHAFDGLERFFGRIAVNGTDSQSGFAALQLALLRPNGSPRGALDICQTGSHRASIKAVAEGRAELAAIDVVSFKLALRHMPETAAVTVVGCTSPTPGLPLITARPAVELEPMRAAVREAIVGLGNECRKALLITGFEVIEDRAYDVVEAGWRLLEDRGLAYTGQSADIAAVGLR
ncbi:phosphate/phosphite/phosphonate ABC transporter substrate-binding protein [Rhizobium deserti]|nr:PhnD/SsuA/transferrin family substrate-binding protein [Rhizobium deserti]